MGEEPIELFRALRFTADCRIMEAREPVIPPWEFQYTWLSANQVFHVKHSGLSQTPERTIEDALALFREVARDVGGSMDEAKARRLRTWAELVVEWRRPAQLTSIDTAGEVITELMVPALYALRVATIEDRFHVVDYGCGSGCTGAALNITCGKGHWWLVDTDEKKLTFCRYAVRRCGIDNMKVTSPREFRELGIPVHVVLIRAMPRRTNPVLNAARILHEDGTIVRWIPERDAKEAQGAVQCGSSQLWVVAVRASNVSRETLAT